MLANCSGVFSLQHLSIRQNLLGEIADDIVAIDQAMKWGFGWQQGPFETWDAIGVEKSVAENGGGRHEIPALG